jgi:ATP synthase protein I
MNNSGKDPDSQPGSESTTRAETSELAARIKRTQEARKAGSAQKDASRQGDMSMLARGLRIGTEFVAAILVGSGIGYLIDQFAGTAPWALLIMFMVGFAAGILNVTRVVAELNKESADTADKADRLD